MKVYYLVHDCGDGSCYVAWYEHLSAAEQRLQDSEDGDGIDSCLNDGGVRSINLPDGFDISTLGVRFSDKE